jgi:CxxC motif-containing protein (DUF1111 family)
MKYSILVLLMFTLACGPKKVTVVVPLGLPEAPTGFDLLTNGFVDQTRHDADRAQFEEPAGAELGPNYNARACAHCHDTPVTGASSQVFEHRTNASARLVHDRSTNPEEQQRANPGDVNALRPSLSLMGDGFVEAVPDALLRDIAKQNGGQFIVVPVLEMPGTIHVGRFGIKDQHTSLLSFAGDADFNEKGVGNRLVLDPDNGIEDQEDSCEGGGEDIDCYARFMRALKAPSRGLITPSVNQGEQVFVRIGCAVCHVPVLFTDTVKFHPFGDYLLHDIGTGDGVTQGDAPANKVRTAPLWGLRARARFLHDGRAFDLQTAIAQHRKEASSARRAFNRLNDTDKENLLAFLNSL